MDRIIAKKIVSENIVRFEISTSIPVNEIKPGQYIILRIEKNDPDFPLPIIKTNAEQQTITVLVSLTDDSSRQLASLNAGSTHFELEGPFGYPTQIDHFGTVVCIGQESDILHLLAILPALRVAGNHIISVLSASTKEKIILQNEISALSHEVIVITEDGSCGVKGSICQVVGQLLRNNHVHQVFVMGSAKTIKETCSITTKYNIATQAVLHSRKPIKNGVHGIFRVSNCGNARSVCVDGFNFNAWYPSFDELIKRFGEATLELQGKGIELDQMNVSL